MNATQFYANRAWNGFVTEGGLRDQFANAVARRIADDSRDAEVIGFAAVLVSDFAGQCDAIFAAHNPADGDAVDALADQIDTADLYELVSNDDD